MIRRLMLLLALGLSLAGCGTAAERSEFWKHDTMYKNWDHMKFSWSGYADPTEETLKKSQEQGWWGIPIPEDKE